MKAPFRVRTADELRKQAQENRDAAETAVDPKKKATFLRLAKRYEVLADEQDFVMRPSKTRGENKSDKPSRT